MRITKLILEFSSSYHPPPPPKKDPRKILGAYWGINHVTIGNILGNCLQNWGHVENIIGNLWINPKNIHYKMTV